MHQYAPSYIKWAYSLVVLSAAFPIVLASSGWMALAKGSIYGGIPFLGSLVLLVIGLYRVFLIVSVPGTLDAHTMTGFGNVLRKIGIFLLIVGAIFSILNLSAPLLFALPANRVTVVFFFAGMFLSVLGSVGLLGLILFEFSRLLGFERHAREQDSEECGV